MPFPFLSPLQWWESLFLNAYCYYLEVAYVYLKIYQQVYLFLIYILLNDTCQTFQFLVIVDFFFFFNQKILAKIYLLMYIYWMSWVCFPWNNACRLKGIASAWTIYPEKSDCSHSRHTAFFHPLKSYDHGVSTTSVGEGLSCTKLTTILCGYLAPFVWVPGSYIYLHKCEICAPCHSWHASFWGFV